MAEPLDAITAFHNAFRNDITGVDSAALEYARGNKGILPKIERYRFLNEVLVWHANGEELAIFPAVEKVAPMVAEAYERDHRGLDTAFNALDTAVSANDALAMARATAAFKFHLDIHLAKEDAHLYRLVRERISMADQGKAVGIMANEVPQERYPEIVAWMFPLIEDNDRENMIRIWQMVMPPPAFDQTILLVKKAIGDEWAEMTRRIPELE
jgi:hypothetical protein